MKARSALRRRLHRLRIAARWVVAAVALTVLATTAWLWIGARSQQVYRAWHWCRYIRSEQATAFASVLSTRLAKLALFENWETHAKRDHLLIAWNRYWIEPDSSQPPASVAGTGRVPSEYLSRRSEPVSKGPGNWTVNEYWQYRFLDRSVLDLYPIRSFVDTKFNDYYPTIHPLNRESIIELAGLRLTRSKYALRGDWNIIEIPYWMLLLASGLPLLWLSRHPIRAIIKLRRDKSACERCGYSLRGLPANSPCPECGQNGMLNS